MGIFWSILQNLGLANKNARLLFLGLDNAGKTTLLHMLRDNRLVQHPPTHHPTCEELLIDNIKFIAYDLGGHKEARRLWSDYFNTVDGIIYIIDVSDTNRISETKLELDYLLMNNNIDGVPIVILGNKIDKYGALSERQLRESIGLHYTTGTGVVKLSDGVRPIEIFMCSISEREGYGEAFRWLSQYIK